MSSGVRPIHSFYFTLLSLTGSDVYAQTALDSGFGASGKIMVLLLVVVFLLLVRYQLGAGKSGSSHDTASGNIRLVSTLTLGMREKLAVVEVGGQRVLIGIAQGNIRTLARLQAPAMSKESEQDLPLPQSGFGQILKRMMP